MLSRLLLIVLLGSCAHPFALRPGGLLEHGIDARPLPNSGDAVYGAEQLVIWRRHEEIVWLNELGFSWGDIFEAEFIAIGALSISIGAPGLAMFAVPIVMPLVAEASESPLHFVVWQLPAVILPLKEGVGLTGREYVDLEGKASGGRARNLRPVVSPHTWYTEKMARRVVRLVPRHGARR